MPATWSRRRTDVELSYKITVRLDGYQIPAESVEPFMSILDDYVLEKLDAVAKLTKNKFQEILSVNTEPLPLGK
jgi:hypothetical protein